MIHTRRFASMVLLVLSIVLPLGRNAEAYSLFTHERLIDLTWKESIVPLLLSRYPTLTAEQLEHARAYAYAGCVIQDIGYYPFGDKSFSNLTHYVRSGDFVINLFRNAGNADELAFAVGALSHYIGDSVGHSEATNISVPVEFPRLAAKYGSVVSYAEGEHQHVQTEFGFDINEITHHRMAPVGYVRHVGLKVPIQQLALAFYQTYGLEEDFQGTRDRRINVRGYRFSVHEFIPRVAYAVTVLHRRREPREAPSPEVAAIDAEVAKVAAENDWARYRRKAGIGTYSLAGLIFILPKVGPLKLTAVKGPTAETELEYLRSVDNSAVSLRRVLARFTPPRGLRSTAAGAAPADPHSDPPSSDPSSSELVGANTSSRQDVPRVSIDPRHPLPNRDLDTGKVVQPGGYSLTDSTYADLLHHLAGVPTRPIPPGIKMDIENFYANPDLPITTKKDPSKWAQVQADLKTLKTMPVSNEPSVFKTYDDGKD